MGVPKEHRKKFELFKYYEHFGSERIHIIAEAKESDMWMIDPGHVMFIAESRSGSLKPITSALRPVTSNLCGCYGWYEISRHIFLHDINFKEYKFGFIEIKNKTLTGFKKEIISRFYLRIYDNGEPYFFDTFEHFEEDGLQINLLKNDYNSVFKNIKKHVSFDDMFHIEKLILEKI